MLPDGNAQVKATDQSIAEITRANWQVFYQGLYVSLPMTYADRLFHRAITDDAFLLTDPATGEIAFSFPLPVVALDVRGRYVASYSVQGVQVAYSTKQWDRNREHYEAQFAQRQEEQPDVMAAR